MVDQKKSEQIETIGGNEPRDPERRKTIKAIALGGAGLAAFGTAFLLVRGSSQQNEVSPDTTAPFNDESVPSTQPDTTVLQTTSTTIEANEPAPPTTTPVEGEAETLSIPLESLPTSIEDPEEWVSKVYSIYSTAYNEHDYQLLEYIFAGGIEGQGATNRINDAETARIHKLDDSDEDGVVISGRLVKERTNLTTGFVISVEEILDFKDIHIRKILDYSLIRQDIYVQTDRGLESTSIYPINSVEVICEFVNNVCR